MALPPAGTPTTWDGPDLDVYQGQGWSVMGILRERQRFDREEISRARGMVEAYEERMKRPRKPESVDDGFSPEKERPVGFMSAGPVDPSKEDFILARRRGFPVIVAFLFAHPDSGAMRTLDARGKYFDVRTRDTWDLFFPGYYRSARANVYEKARRARPVGQDYLYDWYFSPEGFDTVREYVERRCQGLWEYSGEADLVLVNGWIPDEGDPVIDWVSTISGKVTDQVSGTRTLTISGVIERITRDLESANEDPAYGVGVVTDENNDLPSDSHVARDFLINALAGIAASLGAHLLGA
jgi:hypothetical protein